MLSGAGCGDDEGAAQQDTATYALATEPPEVFAERLANLLRTSTKGQCEELAQINGRSLARFPCPSEKSVRRSMASFSVVDTEIYGTGAVVDYKSGEADEGATIVLFVAPGREWGVSRFGIIAEPAAGTSDAKSRAGFQKAAEDYAEAVRTRDCKAFVAVASTGDNSDAVACKTIFPNTSALAKRMKDDPGAKPRYEGGNESFGFFTLETSKPVPGSVTISVVRTSTGSGEQYVVLDSATSLTAGQRRAIVAATKRAQKRGPESDSPETSPSRKAD